MTENPDDRIERDLAALRRASAHDAPTLDQTIHAARRRRLERGGGVEPIRRKLVSAIHLVRTRPAAAAVAAGALVVLAALVVPVSYDRAVGHDVGLTLSGVGDPELRTIAGDLKQRLKTDGVRVEAVAEGGAPRFTLRASTSDRSRSSVAREAGAFARELAARGISAAVQVSPRIERVRYPALAYAWDQIIQISVDGKSASQLESEIRQRLGEAGVPDAQVSVTDHPDGGRDINLRVERRHEGTAGSMPPEPMPQLVLTKDGMPIADGVGVGVNVKKKIVNGVKSLVVEVTSKGRTATAEVPNADSMSDADLREAILAKLRQAGIDDVRIDVVNGDVKVEAR